MIRHTLENYIFCAFLLFSVACGGSEDAETSTGADSAGDAAGDTVENDVSTTGDGVDSGNGKEEGFAVRACILKTKNGTTSCDEELVIDFGSVNAGAGSYGTVELTNVGTVPARLSSIIIESDDFEISVTADELEEAVELPHSMFMGAKAYATITLKPGAPTGALSADSAHIKLSAQFFEDLDFDVVLEGQVTSCDDGMGDCDANPDNGCETFLQTETGHCGSCDNACTAANGTASCKNGSCVASCDEGWEGEHCDNDIDECAADESPCDVKADCANTDGGYTCSCSEGWSGNGATCSDIDECAAVETPCDDNAACANTDGGYTCVCNPGFEGDGKSCIDADECAGENPCDANAVCINADGSFLCKCMVGFDGDGLKCEDVDECALSESICDVNAECVNTEGSYGCTCNVGWVGDGKSCIDDNECAAEAGSPCDANATCANAKGSYTCTCNLGFTGDGKSCSDVDECEPKGIDSPACKACVCATDLVCCTNWDQYCDECADGSGTKWCEAGICADSCEGTTLKKCDPNATCENTVGSFVCTCASGYSGDGSECTDINECVDGSANCPANSICNNTEGAYECSCKPGYIGSGATCVDIDECKTGTVNCGPDASCENSDGSYECVCNPGFEGNGTDCGPDGKSCDSAISVALVPFTASGDTSDATSDYGYSTGSCPGEAEGWGAVSPDHAYSFSPQKDGIFVFTLKAEFDSTLYVVTNCADVDASCLGADDEFGANKLEQVTAELNADTTYFIIVDGWAKSGETPAAAQGQYTLFVDIDECASGTDNCSSNATCSDIAKGGFSCSCHVGYDGDGVVCNDDNECVLNTFECDKNASCGNTPGSYECVCNAGYSGDGKSCKDVNECANGSAQCDINAACSNTIGSYDCKCNNGLTGDGKTCVDINECADGTAGCDSNASCANLPGSYTCNCNSGYSGNGKICSDINECTDGSAQCDINATCSNSDGSYDCQCNDGYTGNGKTCVELNPCIDGTANCDSNASCTVTPSGYSCECKGGYTGNGVTCTDIDECFIALNSAGSQQFYENFSNAAVIGAGSSGRWMRRDEVGATNNTPGSWSVSNGRAKQSSNIKGGSIPNSWGTLLLQSKLQVLDGTLKAKLTSSDNDVIGLVFRYNHKTGDHYRLIVNRDGNSQKPRGTWLLKVENGNFTVLVKGNKYYAWNQPFQVTIVMSGNHIVVQTLAQTFNYKDSSPLGEGTIGLLSADNGDSRFDDVYFSPGAKCGLHGQCINEPGGSSCGCTQGGTWNASLNKCVSGDGQNKESPGHSCRTLLNYYPSLLSQDNDYWIKPGTDAVKVKCDMSAEGGGYTLLEVDGLEINKTTDKNSCQPFGMEPMIARSKAIRDSMFDLYGADYMEVVTGVSKPQSGDNFTYCPMRSRYHYGSGCPSWQATDGGRWWLADQKDSEPNGNYQANCLLGYHVNNNGFSGFDDWNCTFSSSKYICSTNDKP
ncbi:MAG TPA: hypothetical protein EYN66_00355 [Myxococcales bacterium]|nr:hypothetical protein [Myxococcales bacterium]